MNKFRKIGLGIIVLAIVGCSSSSRDEEPRVFNTEIPDPTMGCSAYAVTAEGSDAAFEVRAEFGVPPFTVSGLTYDTDPTGDEDISFDEEAFAFNVTNVIQVNGIPANAQTVFGDVEISDATGLTASCSFSLDVSGTSSGGSVQDRCQILFSQQPAFVGQVVYLSVVPTTAPGFYWLENVRSVSGFVYGGSPDGITGQMAFMRSGIFPVEAEVRDPDTGETGYCYGHQWVF